MSSIEKRKEIVTRIFLELLFLEQAFQADSANEFWQTKGLGVNLDATLAEVIENKARNRFSGSLKIAYHTKQKYT